MKKEILLFTGWGATCDVWKLIIPVLSERYQVNCHSPSWLSDDNNNMNSSLHDFDQYIAELAALLNNSVNVVAWSMGGLLAIALAKRYPHLVDKICFVSSVPTFVHRDNQNVGIDYDWYQSFQRQYQQHPLKTLKRFLTLQVQGDASAKTILNELKNICSFERYDLVECGYGLALLSKLNYKQDLKSLMCETFFVHGRNDAVVNLQSAKHAAEVSNSPIYVIDQAGHVPQLSQAEEVSNIIKQTFNS